MTYKNDVETPMRHPSEVVASADGAGTRTYSTRCKKALVQRIQALDNTDHEEIFAKLKAHGIPHSQNTNGAFVNLTFVPCGVIAEIDAFVEYCTQNQRALDEYDMKLNACKLHQRYDTLLSIHDTPPPPPPAADDAEQEQEQEQEPEAPSAPPATAPAVEGEEATPPPPPPPPPLSLPNPKKVSTKFVAAKKRFAKKKGGGDGIDETTTAKGTSKKSAESSEALGEELTPE